MYVQYEGVSLILNIAGFIIDSSKHNRILSVSISNRSTALRSVSIRGARSHPLAAHLGAAASTGPGRLCMRGICDRESEPWRDSFSQRYPFKSPKSFRQLISTLEYTQEAFSVPPKFKQCESLALPMIRR